MRSNRVAGSQKGRQTFLEGGQLPSRAIYSVTATPWTRKEGMYCRTLNRELEIVRLPVNAATLMAPAGLISRASGFSDRTCSLNPAILDQSGKVERASGLRTTVTLEIRRATQNEAASKNGVFEYEKAGSRFQTDLSFAVYRRGVYAKDRLRPAAFAQSLSCRRFTYFVYFFM